MSGRIYEYYLTCDLSELKTSQAVEDLITNPDKYQFIWFCQNASKERIETLLSEENIEVLLSSSDAKYKIEGGILSGMVDTSILQNRTLCDFIHSHLPKVGGMLENSANDYLDYIEQNYPEEIVQSFGSLYDDVQLNCLKTRQFNSETINRILFKCHKKSMNYLINTDLRIDLSNTNYFEFSMLAQNIVNIPDRVLTPTVMRNITQMDNVNKYRFLIQTLEEGNDVSNIELERKKFYEKALASIDEDGLLPEYRELLSKVQKGLTKEDFQKCLGSFDDNNKVKSAFFASKNKKEAIKRLNDYKISNMIIDYFFEDIPSNILTDMQEMLNFQQHKQTLSELEFKMYSVLSHIDELKTQDKIAIFEKLKGKDLISKFYDDYSRTKEEMVNEFNENILNKTNIQPFKDIALSQENDVPIYVLNGQPFKALIRGWGKRKDYPLTKSDIEHRYDGASFSIDSSDLLNPFQDPHDTYTIAYSSIPKKQLIHAFPTDSDTDYKRNRDSGIPDKDTKTSQRILKLMSSKEITNETANYNELLIAVPNVTRLNSEFDKQLESPEPLAIYCYDKISQNDIKTARELGIGIILVKTESYHIDKRNGLDIASTTSLGRIDNPFDYLTEYNSDLRLDSMLSKPSPDTPKIARSSDDYDID